MWKRALSTAAQTAQPISAAQMPTPRSVGHGLQFRRVEKAEGEEDNSPVVVVVGWMGAKESQLKNYVNFYNSNGVHSLSFAVGPGHVLSPTKAMDFMKNVLDKVKDISQEPVLRNSKNKPRPVIFHCFSMGKHVHRLTLDFIKNYYAIIQVVICMDKLFWR